MKRPAAICGYQPELRRSLTRLRPGGLRRSSPSLPLEFPNRSELGSKEEEQDEP